MIGEALRRQVYQAREDIIDALYPVIGQMIARAVTEAVRTFAQQVDNQLRRGTQVIFEPRYWQARLRGVSTREFELRDALPFTVHKIFLIQRDSGLLICHSSTEERPDRDLVSGMLTAIRDFARDTFGRDESGELGEIASSRARSCWRPAARPTWPSWSPACRRATSASRCAGP